MFVTRDRETGTVIDEFSSEKAAQTALEGYEQEDKDNGTYTPDFYEVVEV